MIVAPRALPSNRLVNSQAYPKILLLYNEKLKTEGRVNAKKFYEEVVSKEIRSYSLRAWYQFLKRFKTPVGVVATVVSPDAKEDKAIIEAQTEVTILSNQDATAKLISGLLNISAKAAMELIKDPSKLSAKEALELGLKGMRAQDSRIHAVGKIREDNREQERFEKAFDGSSFGDE